MPSQAVGRAVQSCSSNRIEKFCERKENDILGHVVFAREYGTVGENIVLNKSKRENRLKKKNVKALVYRTYDRVYNRSSIGAIINCGNRLRTIDSSPSERFSYELA